MKKVILNCEKLLQRKEAHRYLAETLDFPEYYGKNLDALYDCLTELSGVELVLREAELLRKTEGYGARILLALRDAERANPNIKLSYDFEDEKITENLGEENVNDVQ